MLEVYGLGISFHHPERLWWMAPAFVVILALVAWNYAADVKAFRDRWLRIHLDLVRPYAGRYLARTIGLFALVSLLIGAWAEPLRQTRSGEAVYGGVRVAFLLDISLSMKYAHDVAPYRDRLTAAKSIIEDFATMTVRDPELRGEYWRAIIPFAGTAMPLLPFSSSYEEFVSAISAVDETTITDLGTDLLSPILEYKKMLQEYPKQTQETVDIVVLISDGGKGESVQDTAPYIKAVLLGMQNTVMLTVGVGTIGAGAKLDMLDHEGRLIRHILYDPDDPEKDCAPDDKKCTKPVVSILDERVLQEIAGKENYMHYAGREDFLAKLKSVILENRKLASTLERVHATPISAWFLVPALIIAAFMFGYVDRLAALLMYPFRHRVRNSS